MRTAMLAAAWQLRCRRAATSQQFCPRDVAQAFVADICKLVHADWQCVSSNITSIAGTHQSWFKGRRTDMSVVEFEIKWCGGGVVAVVTQSTNGPVLEFCLDEALDAFDT